MKNDKNKPTEPVIPAAEELTDAEDNIITLTSEEGEQIDFYHEATIEYEGEWYVFLHPVDEMPEIGEDEVVIFKLVKGEDGDESLEPIEDEDLLNKVYDEYVKAVDNCEDEEEGCGCGEESECGCDCGDEGSDCGCGCHKK